MPEIVKWILAAYLVCINLVSFGQMGADKKRAKTGARRVRERTLFLTALAGGGLGACLGMLVYRHKTKHWYFVLGMPAIFIAWCVLIAWIVIRFVK